MHGKGSNAPEDENCAALRELASLATEKDAPTDVRLVLAFEQRDHWDRHETAWTVIPSLLTPRGACSQTGVGYSNTLLAPLGAFEMGGASDRYESDGAYSYVVLQTGLDPNTLAEHYTSQLEAADWIRTDEGGSGPQAWSTWALKDERSRFWTGTFTALAGPPDRYLLQIHAGRTPAA